MEAMKATSQVPASTILLAVHELEFSDGCLSTTCADEAEGCSVPMNFFKEWEMCGDVHWMREGCCEQVFTVTVRLFRYMS